ncbi:MAG: LytTR family transcriptional regulator DNA-binding domain-containing protein [Muribaculaceae bacterium]
MNRICINGRDELMVIDLTKVACLKADVDYTTLYHIGGLTATLPFNLARMEALLATVPKTRECDFIRLGRSCIINQYYLYRVQTLLQKVVLTDGVKAITLGVSKEALKKYKQMMAERFNSPTNHGN